jgi:cytochrome c-type biogenesis protein CcmH/NrfF
MLSVVLALAPSMAYGQPQPMPEAPAAHEVNPNQVIEQTKDERLLFQQLLCDCESCPKEPLETCTCGWAANARDEARRQLARGKSIATIVADYAAEHGPDTIIVQATTGANRMIWAIPLTIGLAGVALIWQLSKRWRSAASDSEEKAKSGARRDEYDDKLDSELEDLD